MDGGGGGAELGGYLNKSKLFRLCQDKNIWSVSYLKMAKMIFQV